MTAAPRRRCLAIAALLAAALAGCGGGSSSSSTPAGSASSSSVSSSSAAAPSVPPGTPNGVASKSAPQIIAAAEAALGAIHSFHLDARTVQSGRPNAIAGDVQLPGRLSVMITSGPARVQLTAIDNKLYFNGNTAYFVAQNAGSTAIQQLANRWVWFPAGTGPSLGSLSGAVNPATIGQCLIAVHPGTVSVKGHGSVNGQPAVIVADHGDRPGATPGLLYVATTGPPLPLRIVQTGPEKPGGTPNITCMETKADVAGTTTQSLSTFSQYNSAADIVAPPGAVPINSLGG